MTRIGIIGAENTHCTAIAKICNVHLKAGDTRVVAVWGETPEFAAAAAQKANIPIIVKDWKEMLGQVDGVMIDHRAADQHFEPAKFFLENRIPCFVDKPFTKTLDEARTLCELATKNQTALTSFSTFLVQQSFLDIQSALSDLLPLSGVTTSGPADLSSAWNGFYFYGVHQVEIVLELMGIEVQSVTMTPHQRHAVATLNFSNGSIASMNLIADACKEFHVLVTGKKSALFAPLKHDPDPYLAGTQRFVEMFRTGKEPYSHARILATVAVLQAMEKSMKSGRAEVINDK